MSAKYGRLLGAYEHTPGRRACKRFLENKL
jgi:hypothetical protein